MRTSANLVWNGALTLVLLAGCTSSGGETTSGPGTTGEPGSSSGGTTGASPTGSEGSSGVGESSSGTGEAPTSTTEAVDTTTTGEPGTTATTATTEADDTSGSTGDASSSSSGAVPVCGDGNVDMDETCDDGNTFAGDGCDADCAKECTALHFEGKTFVPAMDPTKLSVKSVTLAAWHKAKADAPYGNVAAKQGNDLGGHITYNIAVGSNGITARLQTKVDQEFLDLSDPMGKPDGTWHHVAVTYDAATGDGVLYYDGAIVDTDKKGTGLVAADPKLPFAIGATTLNGGFEYPSKADIADIVVYDKPLSAAEVMGLVTGVYPPEPIALFLTAEGMGPMSADASGNGHTLTVPDGGWVADGPFCTP